jgi:hypothetical protein
MSLDFFKSRYSEQLKGIGKGALSAIFPDEFEYYALQFQLYSINQAKVVDELIFPVLPNSYSEQKLNVVNIKKSSAGIVSLFNNTHNPLIVSIAGSFGRSAKILLNTSIDNGKRGRKSLFDASIKTGYGVLKQLESLIKSSFELDSFNSAYLLLMYNYTLGNHYVIEVVDYAFNQSVENNMMWNYTLNIKTLGLIKDLDFLTEEERRKQLRRNISFQALNSRITKDLFQAKSINRDMNLTNQRFIT